MFFSTKPYKTSHCFIIRRYLRIKSQGGDKMKVSMFNEEKTFYLGMNDRVFKRIK